MEEQTNPSNDTAEQSVPKQETTFEEEETSPPQGTSTDPLTQIADTLSKLLVARSPREIDVSPYDGTFEAQSFFDNFDAQADRAELTYTDRLRKLPYYLQDTDRLIPSNDRSVVCTLFGHQIDTPNAPRRILPKQNDQRLIATVQPNTIKEWFDLVSRIRGTQCATSAVYQRQVDKAPHPTYHNPPPRVNNGSHRAEHAQSTAPDHAQPLYQNVVPTPGPRSNLRAMFPKSKLQAKTTLQAPRATQRCWLCASSIKMSRDLLWMVMRNNSSYLLKRPNIKTQFSTDPLNLKNIHCPRHIGIINEAACAVEPAAKKGIKLVIKKSKMGLKPNKSLLKRMVNRNARKTNKIIKDDIHASGYRKDLKMAALRRASAILLSQKPYKPKKGGAAKKTE
ncbi:RPL28 [Cordylochernes scorpioides]|uniref:Large ribosomal subunit protein eL28 n=1 Tax=Cordylochernes scorpioides TaxID=51811 RepID=A0ABY6KBR5_9ARAC|nr:RPL28 [Cordylochernes scorpioides]